MDTWEVIGALSGHRGLVLALACYGDRLISGSDDRCIRVWRLGTWECERTLTGHNGGVVGVCIVHGTFPPLCHHIRLDSFCPPARLPICTTSFRTMVMYRLPLHTGNLVSASNDSFIKVWNSTGIQRPFTAK